MADANKARTRPYSQELVEQAYNIEQQLGAHAARRDDLARQVQAAEAELTTLRARLHAVRDRIETARHAEHVQAAMVVPEMERTITEIERNTETTQSMLNTLEAQKAARDAEAKAYELGRKDAEEVAAAPTRKRRGRKKKVGRKAKAKASPAVRKVGKRGGRRKKATAVAEAPKASLPRRAPGRRGRKKSVGAPPPAAKDNVHAFTPAEAAARSVAVSASDTGPSEAEREAAATT